MSTAQIKSGAMKLRTNLNLRWSPVAVKFLSSPPADVPRVERPMPAGCGYWKHASEGHSFYTTPEDHYSCTIGAFTHGVELPQEQTQELESVIGTMVSLQYVQSSEVPSIPHRTAPFHFAAYAPLEDASYDADVVLIRGNAKQLMLVSEAARAAHVFDGGATMGRPACAAIPWAIDSGRGAISLGCIGNRVYTHLLDDEFYLVIPGQGVPATLEKLDTILHANEQLEVFHRQRAAS